MTTAPDAMPAIFYALKDVATVLLLEADILETLEHATHAGVLRRQADVIEKQLQEIREGRTVIVDANREGPVC